MGTSKRSKIFWLGKIKIEEDVINAIATKGRRKGGARDDEVV